MTGARELTGPRGTRLRPVRFASDRLAGILHAPDGTAPVRAAVLCPPLFFEAQLCQRTLRALADRLASQGALVLRLDYAGTGDSAGDPGEVGPAGWVSDIRAGLALVQAEAPGRPTCLAGIRLGATLALHAAAEAARGEAPLVVAWAPVVDGASWVEEMEAAHAAWFAAYRAQHGRHADAGSERGRILGQPVPEPLRAALRDVGPLASGSPCALLVESEGDEPPGSERGSPETALGDADALTVPGPAPWRGDTSAVAPPVPARAVEAIASAIGARLS